MKVHSIEFSPKDFWNKLNTHLGNWVQLTMMIDHDDWKLLTSNKVNNLNWYLIRIQPFRKFKLSFLTYSSTYSSGSYSYSDFITFGWSAYIGCFVQFVCYGYSMVIKSVCSILLGQLSQVIRQTHSLCSYCYEITCKLSHKSRWLAEIKMMTKGHALKCMH